MIKESLEGLSQLAKKIMDEHVGPSQAGIYQARNQSGISNAQWERNLRELKVTS